MVGSALLLLLLWWWVVEGSFLQRLRLVDSEVRLLDYHVHDLFSPNIPSNNNPTTTTNTTCEKELSSWLKMHCDAVDDMWRQVLAGKEDHGRVDSDLPHLEGTFHHQITHPFNSKEELTLKVLWHLRRLHLLARHKLAWPCPLDLFRLHGQIDKAPIADYAKRPMLLLTMHLALMGATAPTDWIRWLAHPLFSCHDAFITDNPMKGDNPMKEDNPMKGGNPMEGDNPMKKDNHMKDNFPIKENNPMEGDDPMPMVGDNPIKDEWLRRMGQRMLFERRFRTTLPLAEGLLEAVLTPPQLARFTRELDSRFRRMLASPQSFHSTLFHI